ncbi:MAG: hypothetical protein MJZ16_05820 [Bacteroidales bacterium]|nr:hypothetical protein [Bacteroidales bacterium]
MKATFKYLSLIFVSILCSLALASCGGGDDPLGPDDPDEEEIVSKGTLKIGDKSFDIRTAGYFYSTEDKGYNIVVSSTVVNMKKQLIGVPLGYLIVMDIPEEYIGKDMNIKDIENSVYEDGSGWNFYLSYVENGKNPGQFLIDRDMIESGTISWTFNENGTGVGKLSATLKTGVKLYCDYSGVVQKSNEYICPWL